MRRCLVLIAAAGFLTAGAFAVPLDEVEPNDSFATAMPLPPDFFDGYGAGAVEGFLAAVDVDFYAVALPADVLVTASVFDFTPDDDYDNDSYLGVFDPSGALFDTDDDDGPGYLSAIHFIPAEPGVWAFAVTGYGDTDFTGAHDEEFEYRLVLSIPEPGSLSLLLIGLGVALRRR